MIDSTYHVSISESGLLIGIETLERGVRTGEVLIDRRYWAGLVQTVASALTERRVDAEIANILDPDDE